MIPFLGCQFSQKTSFRAIRCGSDRLLSSFKAISRAPLTVDFNVNGACNLRCPWCWGPDHKAKEELTTDDWQRAAQKLSALGTKNITFTGGEPLMKEGLREILQYTHTHLRMRNTLSTNGILLQRLAPKIV